MPLGIRVGPSRLSEWLAAGTFERDRFARFRDFTKARTGKADMRTLSADQLSSWKGRIVDVRSLAEFAGERLPGAECVPLDTLLDAAASWKRDEPLLLMCKSGARSRQAYDQLAAVGFTNHATLGGGLDACQRAGVNMIRGRKTIPIIRQVLIAAGSLLLLSLALAWLDARFLLLTGFVALGLFMAGLTGFCPMAKLLERMPWNRVSACTSAGCGCESAVQQG